MIFDNKFTEKKQTKRACITKAIYLIYLCMYFFSSSLSPILSYKNIMSDYMDNYKAQILSPPNPSLNKGTMYSE